MPRLPRLFLPGVAQHIVQRGNNRKACFCSDEDCAAYAHWLREAALKYGVAIHAWVFMTNHVHLLVTPHKPDSASLMMQHLGRLYVPFATSIESTDAAAPSGKVATNPVSFKTITTC